MSNNNTPSYTVTESEDGSKREEACIRSNSPESRQQNADEIARRLMEMHEQLTVEGKAAVGFISALTYVHVGDTEKYFAEGFDNVEAVVDDEGHSKGKLPFRLGLVMHLIGDRNTRLNMVLSIIENYLEDEPEAGEFILKAVLEAGE